MVGRGGILSYEVEEFSKIIIKNQNVRINNLNQDTCGHDSTTHGTPRKSFMF